MGWSGLTVRKGGENRKEEPANGTNSPFLSAWGRSTYVVEGNYSLAHFFSKMGPEIGLGLKEPDKKKNDYGGKEEENARKAPR